MTTSVGRSKMLKIMIIFFCLTSGVCSKLEVQNAIASEQNFMTIIKCISEICKTSLNFRSTVILVYGKNGTVEKDLFIYKLINRIFANHIQQVVLEDINKIEDLVVPEEADWMVLMHFTNCELLSKFDFKMVHDKMKYLIILSDYPDSDCKNKFLQIGKYIANYDVTFIIINHVKNIAKANKTIDIITYIPEIEEGTCKEVVKEFKIMNSCQNGVLKSSDIFPKKHPTDLKKCKLNIGIGPLYPFAIVKDMYTLKTLDKLNEATIRGSDLELVKIAVKQFNATSNYYFVKKKEENPFNQNEFIQFVLNGSLDICAGGFYRIYGNSVAYSGVYARQSIIWIYTADRKDKSWQNLVEHVDGLYIFLIYYIIYCSIWYVICKFDQQQVSAISTLVFAWGAMVGADSLQDARSLKQKIVNLMYLIMCLHLSAYIGVHFYSFYTISEPAEKLDTINDVMRSGRPAYLISSSKYFMIDEKYSNYANESRECNTFYDCFEKSFINKGMTILLQGLFLYYQAQTAIDDEAKILGSTEHVLTVYYEMLIRKNSSYVAKFQDIITRLFEAGIPEKLLSEAVGLTVLGRAKSASENAIANSYRCQVGCEITLEQLGGAFLVWLLGCTISLCVFILECLCNRVSLQ